MSKPKNWGCNWVFVHVCDGSGSRASTRRAFEAEEKQQAYSPRRPAHDSPCYELGALTEGEAETLKRRIGHYFGECRERRLRELAANAKINAGAGS